MRISELASRPASLLVGNHRSNRWNMLDREESRRWEELDVQNHIRGSRPAEWAVCRCTDVSIMTSRYFLTNL